MKKVWVSLKGSRLCDILEDQQQRSEVLSWTIGARICARLGSLESEGEASLLVEVITHSLH